MAVSDHDGPAVCDFCGGTAAPFAPVNTLFEYVYRCLSQEYGDPWIHGIWPDKEEGGWIGITTLDTYEVLDGVGDPFADDSPVAESLFSSIDHVWYEIHSEAGSPTERRIWGWDSFEERLLSGPRFLFSTTEAEWGEESAKAVFQVLASLAERITTGFVKTHDSGLVLFRARVDESRPLTTADDLGSPDPSVAGPQRMSAAGVSCFYAAEDIYTAVEEIKVPPDQFLSVGRWSTTAPLLYADFATRLDLPCLFDFPASEDRPFIGFLREFVQRLGRPARPDLGEANSYLATQVLAEYLRYSLPAGDRVGIDAVRYPSSIRENGVNWVIFGRPDRGQNPLIRLANNANL
ncbi:MAG: HEPN-associated N-terminal domain-containing protein [bacterium]|nr:HEPN-associated N-terminal domain-containing protein [bacterium]